MRTMGRGLSRAVFGMGCPITFPVKSIQQLTRGMCSGNSRIVASETEWRVEWFVEAVGTSGFGSHSRCARFGGAGTGASDWILLAEIIGLPSVGGESESAMFSGGGGDGIVLVEVEVSDCRHDKSYLVGDQPNAAEPHATDAICDFASLRRYMQKIPKYKTLSLLSRPIVPEIRCRANLPRNHRPAVFTLPSK